MEKLKHFFNLPLHHWMLVSTRNLLIFMPSFRDLVRGLLNNLDGYILHFSCLFNFSVRAPLYKNCSNGEENNLLYDTETETCYGGKKCLNTKGSASSI